MKGCKVFSKDDYIDSIISICDESANMDLNAGATHIENGIKKLIERSLKGNLEKFDIVFADFKIHILGVSGNFSSIFKKRSMGIACPDIPEFF